MVSDAEAPTSSFFHRTSSHQGPKTMRNTNQQDKHIQGTLLTLTPKSHGSKKMKITGGQLTFMQFSIYIIFSCSTTLRYYLINNNGIGKKIQYANILKTNCKSYEVRFMKVADINQLLSIPLSGHCLLKWIITLGLKGFSRGVIKTESNQITKQQDA